MAKKTTKKSPKKSSKKKAKKSKSKKGTHVATVQLPPARKGYFRFLSGNEVREVKAKRGGTKGAKRKKKC